MPAGSSNPKILGDGLLPLNDVDCIDEKRHSPTPTSNHPKEVTPNAFWVASWLLVFNGMKSMRDCCSPHGPASEHVFALVPEFTSDGTKGGPKLSGSEGRESLRQAFSTAESFLAWPLS